MEYLKEFEVKKTGGSLFITLTEAFEVLEIKEGDSVQVSVGSDMIIIKRVRK